MTIDGKRVGDLLTDNSHDDDGYRFHDVFHYSNAVLLGLVTDCPRVAPCQTEIGSAHR